MTTRKLPLTLILMMVIVSAGSLVQFQPVSSAFPGANGRIVWASNREGASSDEEIYTMNADGSGVIQLTFNDLPDVDPAWSADGQKIAFIGSDGSGQYVYVMTATGSNILKIPNTFDAGGPAWSPDGSKIAFHRWDGTDYEIWVVNSDGSGAIQLTSNSANDWNLNWSPDGSKIVFESDNDVWVMNSDGLAAQKLTDNGREPNWSPDGTKIVFTRIVSTPPEIWVMNADGTGQNQLTHNDNYDIMPAWSPDGTKIVFIREAESYSDVYTINADGTNELRLTNNYPISDANPDWQPLFRSTVGGVVLPTNKTEIVAPLAALAGLIITVSAVVVKRRRDEVARGE